MAYQFVHTEIHSRAGGKSGSTSYVLDEVQRVEGAHPHVVNPVPPELVHGMPLDALRTLHDSRAEACLVTSKNGQTRRIRSTQNTLATVVTSYPVELATADPAAVKDWERCTVAWLKAEYGDRLKTVVRHVDEAYPHLHAYLLDDGPEMKATALHPGYQAKAAAVAAGGDNKVGDLAYRDAMRGWQDRYWKAVGLPCGLARVGPGRRRLTRAGWHAETTAAQSVVVARKAEAHFRKKGRDHVRQAETEAASIAERAKSQADAAAAAAAAVKAEADKDRAAADKDRKAARTARQQAEAALSGTRAVGTRLAAFWSAARGFLTGERTKIAKTIEEATAAARVPLEVALSDTREKLRAEKQTSKNLKDSARDLAAELRDAQSEIRRLQPPDNPRPGRGPRRT